jgi:glutathione S-transferase
MGAETGSQDRWSDEELVSERKREGKEYFVGNMLTIADIAIVCRVGQIEFSRVGEG